eukprot:scaffold10480_cov28-Tisochrysis_lutea.AAC.1
MSDFKELQDAGVSCVMSCDAEIHQNVHTAYTRSAHAPISYPLHIVANSVSPEHWSFLPGLLKMYPDATVWACPGVADKMYE